MLKVEKIVDPYGFWKPLFGPGKLFGGTYDAYNSEPLPSLRELSAAYDDIVYGIATRICDDVGDQMSRAKLCVSTNKGQEKPKCVTKAIRDREQTSIKNLSYVQRKGANIDEVVDDHPFWDFVENVNPFMSWSHLVGQTQLYLEVTGQAYWKLETVKVGGRTFPKKAWILPSYLVVPILDDKGYPVQYQYGTDPKTADVYESKDIIHFRLYDLLMPYAGGISPVQAVWQRLKLAHKSISSWEAVLNNQAWPSFMVSPPDGEVISEDAAERYAQKFIEQFRLSRQGGLYVATDPLKLSPLQPPVADKSSIDLYDQIVSVVARAYGYPRPLLDMQDSNFASAKTARAQYLASTIRPRFTRLAENITKRVVHLFDPRLFLAPEKPFDIVDDDHELAQEVSDLDRGVKTINEKRRERGEPPVEWGDKPLALQVQQAQGTFGTYQEGDSGTEQQPPEIATPNNDQADATSSNDLRATVGGSQAVLQIQEAYYAGTISYESARANLELVFGFSDQEAAKLLQGKPEQQTTAQPQEPQPAPQPAIKSRRKGKARKPTSIEQFARVLAKYYRRQHDAVLGGLSSAKMVTGKAVPEGTWYDLDGYTPEMVKDLQPIVEAFYSEASKSLVERLGFNDAVPKVVQEKLPEAVKSAVLAFCKSTNDTTSRRLEGALEDTRKAILDGMQEGEAANALGRRVNEIFEGLTVEHSYLIARTEASRAAYAAEKMTIDESGVDVKKKWLAEPINCCDECKQLDGRTLKMDQNFAHGEGPYGTVAHPPFHPLCRCTLEYIVEE